MPHFHKKSISVHIIGYLSQRVHINWIRQASFSSWPSLDTPSCCLFLVQASPSLLNSPSGDPSCQGILWASPSLLGSPSGDPPCQGTDSRAERQSWGSRVKAIASSLCPYVSTIPLSPQAELFFFFNGVFTQFVLNINFSCILHTIFPFSSHT